MAVEIESFSMEFYVGRTNNCKNNVMNIFCTEALQKNKVAGKICFTVVKVSLVQWKVSRKSHPFK